MPKQYIYKIWRVEKNTCTYYHICKNEIDACMWIGTKARIYNWGEPGIDWKIESMTSRSLSEVYNNYGDKISFLSELIDELFDRETNKNYCNTEFEDWNKNDLCDVAIEMLKDLRE